MAADKVPPKKPTNWGRVSKTLSFWILIILIPVAFFQLSGAAREPSAQIDWTRVRGFVSDIGSPTHHTTSTATGATLAAAESGKTW